MGFRQEVLNILLAQLLQERGVVAVPENIEKALGTRKMIDVLVDYQGLRLAIEGEYYSSSAEKKASKSALTRVEEGLAHIGMALIYPSSLKSLSDFGSIKKLLSKEIFSFAVITESEISGQLLLPFASKNLPVNFINGNLDDLIDILHRAFEQIVKDSVLDSAIDILNKSIDVFSSSMSAQPATTERLAEILSNRKI